MPTYEYECNRCHVRFERRQSMKDEPLKECPECGGDVQRMVSGGSGFILKSQGQSLRDSRKSCSLEETGRTCCGATSRCGQSSCGD
ncbi:MAG TPA: zinc ribbon domain-containing protein [Syntrophaceae bacterium]|jgi:putative FmdB family regulatory protein|nr:zinc ribbon domain-containing protein [Syntrophaceae bacterium]HBL53486.1 zinc ribbon domain-containing protein [Syntrophaceae bacterium]